MSTKKKESLLGAVGDLLEGMADVLEGDIFGDDETAAPTTPTAEEVTDETETPRRRTSEGKPRSTVKPAKPAASKGSGASVESGGSGAASSGDADSGTDSAEE